MNKHDGPGPLAPLIRTSHVIVCCGTGGVGKTTTAAALGLAAARAGRRTVVITIDPARRLANALGLDNLGLDPTPVALPGKRTPGELWAMMLDARAQFDQLVEREAPRPEQAKRILANPFYRKIADTLSGTQEYMAVEVLHDLLRHDPPFDVIIVDTPPTRNALAFLDAPGRLITLLDNPVFRALMTPTRAGLRVAGAATQLVLRSLGNVVGGAVVSDTISFFQAFAGMEQGFRRRANATLAALHEQTTAWVLVTTPHPDALEETMFLADQLKARGLRVSAVVANRIAPTFSPVPGRLTMKGGTAAARNARDALNALRDAAEASSIEAEQGNERLRTLTDRFAPSCEIARVPLLANDVHDLSALEHIAQALAGTPARSRRLPPRADVG